MTLRRSCLPFGPGPIPAADAGMALITGATDAIGADSFCAAGVPDALTAGVMRQVKTVASDVTIRCETGVCKRSMRLPRSTATSNELSFFFLVLQSSWSTETGELCLKALRALTKDGMGVFGI